jgi:DNA-binding PadR family transcriptional regulator
MALADCRRHGCAILQDIAARTGGKLKMSAGTPYRSIRRMQEQGLIVESRHRPGPDEDDERRRYSQVTASGSAEASAEAHRLTRLVRPARAGGIMPERARLPREAGRPVQLLRGDGSLVFQTSY